MGSGGMLGSEVAEGAMKGRYAENCRSMPQAEMVGYIEY